MSYLWLPFMIIPIYAGLERIPDSLLSASEDLGASPCTTFRRVILPLVFPAVVAGSIFTFSLTLGDYITPALVSNNQFIGNVVYSNIVNNLPLAVGVRDGADRGHDHLPADRAPARGVRAPMRLSRTIAAGSCGLGVGLTLAFIYIPLVVILIYAFNAGKTLEWPPAGPHPRLVRARRSTTPAPATRSSPRSRPACAATAIALLLGTLASLAVARHQFFGRETISFLVILPIALPGIVTGIALNDTFTQVLGVDLSLFTVIVGHATFCIVRRLQQRRRPPAAGVDLARGGVGRPRRRPVADLPPRHLPEPAHGAGRRRAARLRALLRRDHRHQVHDRRRRSRRCRSGSSTTSSARTSCRSSTSSR